MPFRPLLGYVNGVNGGIKPRIVATSIPGSAKGENFATKASHALSPNDNNCTVFEMCIEPLIFRCNDEMLHQQEPRHRRGIATSNNHTCRQCPGNDEKYGKRRVQQQERLHIGLFMTLSLLAAILVVAVCMLLQHQRSTKRYSRHHMEPWAIGGRTYSDGPLLNSLRKVVSSRNGEDVHWAKLERFERAILKNEHSGIQWTDPSMLLPLDPVNHPNPDTDEEQIFLTKVSGKFSQHGPFFRVSRQGQQMTWQDEWERILRRDPDLRHKLKGSNSRPTVDYTRSDLYKYPIKHLEPPTSGYPKLETLGDLFDRWPQDQIDTPPSSEIEETLQHFDFNDPRDMEAALLYRERKLPFKLTNVPDLLSANLKWTDEYVSQNFDVTSRRNRAQGKAQESSSNFFAFFQPQFWNVEAGMGLPPSRDNDWTFAEWAKHAHYADAVSLSSDQPHFYWQAGVQKEEREVGTEDSSTFISRDLPLFSSPEATFISSSPQDQKGIQCRFGERGVVAAIHFDSGKNMIGMVQGAKRYILAPPNQCPLLGIVTKREHAMFRHSLLNFGHLRFWQDHNMPPEERAWLDRAKHARAVENVVKTGEVLFIPSHWFHYIIGLQKNAQCNVRSGVDAEGDEEFGGQAHVTDLCVPASYPLPSS
jgi:Cupin-like domain